MGVPSPRTPVRIARGTKSVLETNKAALEEGEICYATDENKCYVKEGSNIEDIGTTILDEDNFATNSATAAASQQSVKAYADTKLPLAGGTLTGTLNGTVGTFTGEVTADKFDMVTGTSDEGYYIKDGSGNVKASLYYSNSASVSELLVDRVDFTEGTFLLTAGDEVCIDATKDSSVHLRYDNVKKFETASSGVQVYGDVIFEGATADAHETTLAVTDPTADRTITLPNATGTVGLLQEDQAWSGSQRGTISDVGTKTANFDLDLNTANNFKITIGATFELGFTNITAGQSGTVEAVSNGSWTPTFGSEIHFVGGTVPSLTQSGTSYLAYYCPTGSVVFVQHMLNVKQGGT